MYEIIRKELEKIDVREVIASGTFTLETPKPQLFPGSIYGFAVELSECEAENFFNEAEERGANFLKSFDSFNPIEGNLYPIYWGKDKSLGKRPYEHLGDPKGTGAIRLSTYSSLKNKTIHTVVVVVDDNDKLERHLQRKYPHLLLTKTKQHNAI
ncbi:hypothetical protein CGH86_23305 [Vibrio parahaemolyticus]|uniref:Uncharacterized protein n=3 Tax=Vibrio TaxID=662 RepID=A0ABX3FCN7_9VIBR|nr:MULTISPECIES: hypothetical protein [Vibrio]EKO3808007.1 hypothetical protein [Vibrio harveyi]EHH2490117.1 hypothetical protein [Vibrio parahaemolyticus]EKQ5902551.1 hypothetical protein [Vibrio parahaemolyticus]ELB1485129.1 hypothetical protein [Vibrio parahaemolyticus]MCS0079789.1 hypothetical protein [Vibrio parahaemolyticus]